MSVTSKPCDEGDHEGCAYQTVTVYGNCYVNGVHQGVRGVRCRCECSCHNGSSWMFHSGSLDAQSDETLAQIKEIEAWDTNPKPTPPTYYWPTSD